ncbi:helix-turn-helix transcriptional regulator [Streptacidiphilus carbonis]|uniref:helix-turn-helix transcriptional regulator n=1 Tax=Streptacidiphilus carbonis TaxID=105422 RepID=UPI0005A7764C|nr:helix-turn-helix domain-containing protein [Streptacidiphilus carbonis]
MNSGEDEVLDSVAVLGDPVRRRLYQEVVAAAPAAVGRDGAAAAVGISRSLAAFHLDRLVEAGLLAVTYQRLSGRTGPGAGRPAKLYQRAPGERELSLPPRSYDSVARVLADVVDRAGLDLELQSAAREAGARATAGDGPDPVTELRERGYEPYWDESALRLHNCPFRSLAEEFPALICGMNLALIEGLLPGCAGGEGWTAALDPLPEGCCVSLRSEAGAL